MSVSFADPRWFALLLLIVPLGYVMLRWCVAMTRARRWSAVVARLALLALVAAMLAGASSVRETSKLAVVAVVDVSDSVRRFGFVGYDEAGERQNVVLAVERYLRTLDAGRGPDDLIGIVAFGGESAALATPTRATIAERDLDLSLVEGTDIEDALRLGAALVPPDATGRILLISDGNETTGDAITASEELGSLPIDVVPIGYRVGDETIVESLIVPTQAPPDSVITARVVISTVSGTTGTLRLTSEGTPIDINGGEPGTNRRLTLGPGRHAILIDLPIGTGRINRFEAAFDPDRVAQQGRQAFAGDTHLDNNIAEAFTISPGSGSVLVVDGVSSGNPAGPGAVLANRLEAGGADVRLVAPEGIPSDLLGLQPFDLVMLQNVPADAIDERTQVLLAAHVRDMGGGLIMTGGPASFGSGGWAGTPIEPILPVDLDLSEKLVERRTAIVLVLDASGSMGAKVGGSFQSQQEIANAAAATAARSLGEADLVGVIKFSNSADWVVELGSNEDPAGTTSAIQSIGSGGGTNIPPALDMARTALVNTEAAVKHIIVLSDGQSQGSDRLPGICAALAEQDINVSTISVGDFSDTETMFAMAEKGGGVHYPVTNPSVLPRIFVRAVRIVRDPLIKEGSFTPVRLPSASQVVSGLGDMRPLEGLVLTAFREDPLVTDVLATPEGEPLLSYWSVGLGRVAAFTSDAHNQWAAPWLGWAGYDAFWSQLAQAIARSPTAQGVELTTQIESGRMRLGVLSVDADGEPVDGLIVPATVYGPGGERMDVTLEQIGPGQYDASVDVALSGNYIAVVRPLKDGKPMPPVLGGATQSTSTEYRSLRAQPELLREIADSSGGRVLDLSLPEAARIFDRSEIEPRKAESQLWRSMLIISIVVMLVDIATRRIAWDRFISERSPKAAYARASQTSPSLSQLKRAPKRDEKQEQVQLTDKDAADLAIQARRQRIAARQQARSNPAPTKSEPEVKVEEPPKNTKKKEESGLLAAKRRARERFEEDNS